MQPAALPAPDEPGPWDDLKQPNTCTAHGSRSPPPDHRASGWPPQGRLRRRCAAGLGPGPCPAQPLAIDIGSYRGTGDASHACPRNLNTPVQSLLDTAPLLQG